ncbi:MAG: CocE/NonD family hydrolase [Actinomycetota bacterium]
MPGREHLFLPMRDGVRLHATLYRPDGEGPWPALLEALPYRKDDLTGRDRSEYERYAEAGYAMLRVDVRGTGTSEGPALDEYPPVELDDLNDVIAWLASQPWSNGNVGMFGTSYSGFNSVQVAMTRPEALKAIVTIFATDDRYTYDDVHYFGGALKALDLCDYPVMMAAMNALPPVPSLFGERWREEWEKRVHGNEPWLLRWLEEQSYTPYWKHGSLREDYASITAATMIVAGWADGYWKDAMNVLQKLGCPKKLLQGPWAHASTETSLPGPNIDLVPELIRWFDRWLKDEDNGVDREPQITLFARRPTPPAPDLRAVRGEWRFEPSWPAERMAERTLALADARRAGAAAEGHDVLEVRGDVGWTAWISCAGHLPYGQPVDQRPDEPFSLGYEWGPLEQELEILGTPRFEATLTSDKPVAYLSAKLVDVFPDGTSALAGRGFLNLTHRESHEKPEPLEPGVPVRVTVPFLLTSWIVEPGHRLRLDVAGTDWPNAWTPPEPVTISIDISDAVLVLPTLDGPSPVSERPRLHPATPGVEQETYVARGAGDAPTASRGRERPDGIDWKIEHDVLERRTTITCGSWGTSAAQDDVPETFERYGGVVSVSTEDPGDARTDARSVIRIAYPEATVETEARYSVVSDATTYRIEIELDVRENDEHRWSRRWERSIPRQLQ